VKLSWTDHAWDDYLCWQAQDRKTLKRINALIAEIKRDPDGQGIGKPEILRNNLAGLRPRAYRRRTPHGVHRRGGEITINSAGTTMSRSGPIVTAQRRWANCAKRRRSRPSSLPGRLLDGGPSGCRGSGVAGLASVQDV
jgi:Txe/YoeB family toxin of toxin-antitoxin system